MKSKKYIPSFLYILRARLARKSFVYEFYCKDKRTLDVGCGEGEFLKYDKKLIWGVDTNARVVERLHKEGFHVLKASATELPFPNAEFDVVYCHNVIEHMDIPSAYTLLTESARVLKSGGHFILASEVVTKKFWDTFGHVKPYPPHAVIKLLRPESREEFEGLDTVEPVGLFYIGEYFAWKPLYLLSVLLAYHVPFLRREYYLVLRKK